MRSLSSPLSSSLQKPGRSLASTLALAPLQCLLGPVFLLVLALSVGACGDSTSSGTGTGDASDGGLTDTAPGDAHADDAGAGSDDDAHAHTGDHHDDVDDDHDDASHDDALHDDALHDDGDAHGGDDHHADADGSDEHGDDHEHGSGSSDTHIHAIQWWKDTADIIIGTHMGAWRTQTGSTDLVMLRPDGDFMGLIQDPFTPTRYWGSGHYAAGGFGNWGFIESLDGGVTWDEITLSGQVDFHHMAVGHDQGDVVAGTFGGKVWFSSDAGRSWDSWTWSGQPSGIEVESSTGPVFLLSSTSGIVRVTAPAMTAETVVAANVSGIDRVGDGYGYGTSNGQIHLCDAALDNCEVVASPNGAPALHLLGAPGHLFALVQGSQVFHTEDAGETWTLVVDGQ